MEAPLNLGIICFFVCPYSSLVWKAVIGVLGFTNPPLQWDSVFEWFVSASFNRIQLAAVLQLWHGSIYVIWQERNARYHNGLTKSHWMLSQDVIKQAKDKSSALCETVDLILALVWWRSGLRFKKCSISTAVLFPFTSMVFNDIVTLSLLSL